jgi:uncharacterized membrane protein YgcG
MRKSIKILKFINDHGSMLLLILAVLAVILYFLVQYLKKQDFSDSKKSLIITFYSFGSILLLLFFLRFWPPYGKTEMLIAQGGGGGGVELNFGNTDKGKGEDFLSETLEVNMKEVAAQPVESTPDEILTQDNVGAEVPTPTKTNIKPKDKKPTETKPVETPKIPVKKTNSAISNMIKGNKKGGDGNSSTSGNQGSSNGSTNSNGYYGNGGSGGGTGGGNGTGNGTGSGAGSGSGSGGGNGSGNGTGANYILTGRKRNFEPALGNNCNTYGKVVIEITVDKTGKTISAVNGKGTTGDACLIQQAKQLALKTRWDASDNAAEKQQGKITYNFTN